MQEGSQCRRRFSQYWLPASYWGVHQLRLALDHLDVKITQVMIGPGAIIPAHAEGAPGFYYVTGGRGEITVEGQTQSVTPGTTIKLEPYDIRRIHADRNTTGQRLFLDQGHQQSRCPTGTLGRSHAAEGGFPRPSSGWRMGFQYRLDGLGPKITLC